MTEPSRGVSADFVFGTLATDDLRLAQLRATTSGVHHGHDLEPLDPRPGVPITVRVTVGPAVHADRVTCYVTTDGADPAGERGVATTGTAIACARIGVAWDTLTWGYVETWTATIPGQAHDTLVRYRIEAWSEHAPDSVWASEIAGVVAGDRPPGVSDLDAAMFAFGGSLWPVRRTSPDAVHVDDEPVPEWLRDAVIYQVFVDRFATTGGRPFDEPATPGGFFGGTLRGVIERLDHIVDLGATCLWLSPVFPSPSHHGYDATDYRAIEPRLGTEADLVELTELAHARGLRVILDYVVNHVSSGHAAFQTAVRDETSPEARWFTFTRWPDEYLTFFGVQDHPQIDSDDPGARAYMIESARHWLGLGIDGFRCDYAQGPSHAFWSAFRAATRTIAPDSITLGEVVETSAVQRTFAGRLDGCLDFIGQQALRGAFAFETLGPMALDDFLRRHHAFMPADLVLPSFLDNHDMNRFLWVVEGDTRRLRLAAMCQFTLPHPPIVYYGTEVGLSQDRDVRYADGSGHPEESRLPMRWGDAQDRDLLAFYRDLVALRRRMPSLWRSTRTTLVTDDATGIYAYACRDADRAAVVVLNTGATSQRVDVAAAKGLEIGLATDGSVDVDGERVALGPYAGAILLSGPS
jgi:cyclomaltodextrinase